MLNPRAESSQLPRGGPQTPGRGEGKGGTWEEIAVSSLATAARIPGLSFLNTRFF